MTTTERQPLRYQACANGVSCLADLYECQVFEVERSIKFVEYKAFYDDITETWLDEEWTEQRTCLVAAYDEDHAQTWFHSISDTEADTYSSRPIRRV